jgi:hypothetical protein
MEKISYTNKDELIFEKLQKQGPLGKRALFIFQYLFLRKEFQDFVKKIRDLLKIPENGFDPYNKEDVKEFAGKRKYLTAPFYNSEVIHQNRIFFPNNKFDVNKIIENYVEQCGVLAYAPNMYLADHFISAILREYILFNNFVGIYKNSFALSSVASYGDNTNGNEDQQDPIELRLEIPISAKKEEIIDYINQTWGAIEMTKKLVLHKKDFVRFRPRQKFIRDLKIFNKYLEIEKLSKNQRKEKAIGYIELGVLKELREDGVKDLPDSGTIRSIVSQLRNEIKDKNIFWEEIEQENEEVKNTKNKINKKKKSIDDF